MARASGVSDVVMGTQATGAVPDALCRPWYKRSVAAPTSTRDPRHVLGRRVGAYLIDALVGFVISVVLFFTFADTVDAPPLLDTDRACELLETTESAAFCFASDGTLFFIDGGEAVAVFVVPVTYWLVLNGIVQGLTGATIGKAILGLRTVDERGRICGIPRALTRTVVGVVDSLPTLMGLGFLVAVNRVDRRRLGDLVAKTNVVRTVDVGRRPDQAVATTASAPPPPGSQPGPGPTADGGDSSAAPAAPTAPPSPGDGPPPVPAGADEGPVWDPARGMYVQIQPGSGILVVFDDATQQWRPAEEA